LTAARIASATSRILTPGRLPFVGGSVLATPCRLRPTLPAVEFDSGAAVADEPDAGGRNLTEVAVVSEPAVDRELDAEAPAEVEADARR
jgi:hypothetical protein